MALTALRMAKGAGWADWGCSLRTITRNTLMRKTLETYTQKNIYKFNIKLIIFTALLTETGHQRNAHRYRKYPQQKTIIHPAAFGKSENC